MKVLIQSYAERYLKKYHFMPQVNENIPVHIAHQSEKERRDEDLKLYGRYKDDKSVGEHEDGSLSYYMVDATWIKKWRDFVNRQGPMPGPVVNLPVANYICDNRKKTKYRMYDNDYEVKEPEEVYILSEDFWCVFRDRYGCDLQM